jgi:hypothetical protein
VTRERMLDATGRNCYWAIGFTDKPTLGTGTEALVAAALAWLAPH